MSEPIKQVKDVRDMVDTWSSEVPIEFMERPDISTPMTQMGEHENRLFFMSRIDTPESGGIYVYHFGVKYPLKGYPYPKAVYALNTVKKILLGYLSFYPQENFAFPCVP